MARDYAETLRHMMKLAKREDGNEAESAKAMAKALAFAERHGLDIAMMEAEQEGNLVQDKKIFFRNPGALEKARLFGIIGRHFNCTLVKIGKARHIFGYQNDLNLVDVLFDLLWDHGTYELGIADVPHWYSAGEKKSFTTSFWYAYQEKIADRLHQSKNAILAEAGTGAELVLVKRADDAEEAMNKRYSNLVYQNASRTVRSLRGMTAGTQAGERANLGHVLS